LTKFELDLEQFKAKAMIEIEEAIRVVRKENGEALQKWLDSLPMDSTRKPPVFITRLYGRNYHKIRVG
jgi:hypothetical protein